MTTLEKDGLEVFLFSKGSELLDFKCFRGDRDDISEEDIRKQIHSAFMQREMGRAVVSKEPPSQKVQTVNVKDFVEGLTKLR